MSQAGPARPEPTRKPESVYILGCRVDRVDSDAAAAQIGELVRRGAAAQVVTLGAEMANLAYADRSYRDVINAADLVVPDTIGIVLASRLLGAPVPERVAGVDLLERACADAAASGWGVFFLGSAPDVARAAADALTARHPGLHVVGTEDGYFADADVPKLCARIRESGARLIFVGIGFPRQERFIHDNLAQLGLCVGIGVGGSFDVIAGRLPRAPAAVRAAGLEWLYRLAREPRRLRRQLALPVFAMRTLRQSVSARVGAAQPQVK